MKKTALILIAGLFSILCVGCFGCGERPGYDSFEKEKYGLYLYADLAIEEVISEDFPTDQYNLDEYKQYLSEELAEENKKYPFNPSDPSKHGSKEPALTAPISLVTAEVTKNILTQKLIYVNADVYSAYNEDTIQDKGGKIFGAGRLSDAPSEVLDSKLIAPNGDYCYPKNLLSEGNGSNYRYIICDFEVAIYGDGELIGYSETGKYDKNKGNVTVPSGKKVIIIFKS